MATGTELANMNRQLRIAMVMAAGYGTRMGALTDKCPKPLLPLTENLTILDVVLQQLANQGIERVVVNTHFRSAEMQAHLKSVGRRDLEIIISDEPEILGSGGGIANAERYFEAETIIAVNADVLSTIDIQELYRYHRDRNAIATMNILASENNRDYTLVLADRQRQLQRILSRNEQIPANHLSGIFTGHQILSPQARSYLKPVFQSIMSELYLTAVGQGKTVAVAPFNGEWIDIGTREFYLEFKEDIRSGKINLDKFMAPAARTCFSPS